MKNAAHHCLRITAYGGILRPNTKFAESMTTSGKVKPRRRREGQAASGKVTKARREMVSDRGWLLLREAETRGTVAM